MNVRVRLFAAAKELAQTDTLVVDMPEGATLSQLRAAVIAKIPALELIASHSLWAIGSEYVTDDVNLDERYDVALIPPVSGG
jgi:molybdopterin converting factor small subunit